jgi:hypothetical protein
VDADWNGLRPQRIVKKTKVSSLNLPVGVAIAGIELSNQEPERFHFDTEGNLERPFGFDSGKIPPPFTELDPFEISPRWWKFHVVHLGGTKSKNYRVLLTPEELEEQTLYSTSQTRVRWADQVQEENRFEIWIDVLKGRIFAFTTKDVFTEFCNRLGKVKNISWKITSLDWNLDNLKKTGILENMFQAWAETKHAAVRRLALFGTQVDQSRHYDYKHLRSVRASLSFEGVEHDYFISSDRRLRASDASITKKDLVNLYEALERTL